MSSRTASSVTVLACCLVVAAAASVGASRATISSEKRKDEDCRQFVQRFYTWYAGAEYESWGVSQSLDDALDQNFFSLDLAGQLDDVIDSENDRDEIWLNFDPVLNTKHPWDDYVAGAVTRKGEHFLVDVYGVQRQKRHDQPDVAAELVFQIGRWTFVNFHYPDRAATAASENLLSLLKEIRKSHPVKHHVQPSDEPQA
jgi:hypothetical protein